MKHTLLKEKPGQTAMDLIDRLTIEHAEYEYKVLKERVNSEKIRMVKDNRGYLVTLYYSEAFLQQKGFEIIK